MPYDPSNYPGEYGDPPGLSREERRQRRMLEEGYTHCSRCGNLTLGTREGDTEYCTVCGGALGPASTKE